MHHPSKFEGESISIMTPNYHFFHFNFLLPLFYFPRSLIQNSAAVVRKKSCHQNDACKSELYAKRIGTLYHCQIIYSGIRCMQGYLLTKLRKFSHPFFGFAARKWDHSDDDHQQNLQ